MDELTDRCTERGLNLKVEKETDRWLTWTRGKDGWVDQERWRNGWIVG